MLLPWRDIRPAPPGGGVLGPNRLPRLEITFRSAFCNAQSFCPGFRLSVAPPSPAERAGSAPCGLAKPCGEGRSPVGPVMAGAAAGADPRPRRSAWPGGAGWGDSGAESTPARCVARLGAFAVPASTRSGLLRRLAPKFLANPRAPTGARRKTCGCWLTPGRGCRCPEVDAGPPWARQSVLLAPVAYARGSVRPRAGASPLLAQGPLALRETLRRGAREPQNAASVPPPPGGL